jgi:IS30 family transposase
VSHWTIYRWIKGQRELRSHWESFLRRGGRRRPKEDRRGRIANQVEIAHRPQAANERTRVGDWEGVTVVGKGSRDCLVTIVDRKTGFLISGRTKNRTATRVTDKIVRLMGDLPPSKRHTLTLDNGKEFASHTHIAKSLEMGVYFARPYCSWERGTNENTNGLLRQFIPKGTDIGKVSHQEVSLYVDRLNDRPRKRLNFRTPNEVFNGPELCCN